MKPKLLLSVKQNGHVYETAFARCGAEPTAQYLPEVDLSYDALVLCGGDDVDPKYYGQENTACGAIDPDRDAAEFALLDAYVKAGKPVMGICRGLQLINVYFGGSLHQHIEAVEMHRQSKEHYVVHAVEAMSGSYLESIYGKHFFINSYHHQAIDRLGQGLHVVARSEGAIEAVVHEQKPVFAVQWHPEKLSFEWRREDAVCGEPLLQHFVEYVGRK